MADEFFWYELMTPDQAASEAFYTKVVGWSAAAQNPDGHGLPHTLAIVHQKLGLPKTCFAFSMPMTSAANETRRMKGYITRASVTVSAAFSPSKPGARMATSCGARTTPTMTTKLMKTVVSVATLFARAQAD